MTARDPIRKSAEQMRCECDRFNAAHAVGSEIRVWTGPREGYPKRRTIRAPGAIVLGGHTPVVYVAGGGGCIALTHVEGWR